MPQPLKLAAALLTLAGFLGAAEEWTPKQGGSFRGHPAEALGPLALFRTEGSIQKIPFRYLAPEDCIRFDEALKDQHARAAHWTEATGHLTSQLLGKVKRLENDRLVDASLAAVPEPELVVVFYVDNSEGKSWELLGRSIEPYNQLRSKFPGQVEGLLFGINNSATDQINMATTMKVPWLVADYHDQKHHLEDVRAYAPATAGDFGVIALNRDGVPVFNVHAPKTEEADKFFADVSGLLDLLRPANPRAWPDRVYYARAVQARRFAHGHGDPVLVGDPLVAEGLRDRKIFEVAGTLAIDADGKVTQVTLKPGRVPAAMEGPLADALQRSTAFVPAVQDGKFVAGTFEYHKVVER